MIEEELLITANDKYPEGTMFISAYVYTDANYKHTYYSSGKFFINKTAKGLAVHTAHEYIYFDGKWAEIILNKHEVDLQAALKIIYHD